MQAQGLQLKDYHEFVNSLLDGPSEPGVASFRVVWSASNDAHASHDPASEFEGEFVFTTAQIEWTGRTPTASYTSDPLSPSTTLFAEVGTEQNGVFFHAFNFSLPGHPESKLSLEQGTPPVLVFDLVGFGPNGQPNGYRRTGSTKVPSLTGTILSVQVVGHQIVVQTTTGRYVSRDGFIYQRA